MNTKRVQLNTHEQGVSVLTAAAVVLVLILTIGFAIASSGLLEGFIAEAQRASQEAQLAAEAGVKDALIKLARNKNFTSTGYFIPSDPSNCTLNSDTLCTRVIVEKDSALSCSQSIMSGQDCVIAAGTLGGTTRTIEVILSVNATNGKITQVSWKEI